MMNEKRSPPPRGYDRFFLIESDIFLYHPHTRREGGQDCAEKVDGGVYNQNIAEGWTRSTSQSCSPISLGL